jgi:hypothetical protein
MNTPSFAAWSLAMSQPCMTSRKELGEVDALASTMSWHASWYQGRENGVPNYPPQTCFPTAHDLVQVCTVPFRRGSEHHVKVDCWIHASHRNAICTSSYTVVYATLENLSLSMHVKTARVLSPCYKCIIPPSSNP